MKALIVLGCLLVLLAAGCGSSGDDEGPPTETALSMAPTTTPNPATREPAKPSRAPRVQGHLPEGHLLVHGPLIGPPNWRQTFVIADGSAYELAPTDVAVSADGKFAYYLIRSNYEQDDDFPTSIVVVDMAGAEALRMDIPRNDFGFRWSSEGSRLLYQVGEIAHVRDIGTNAVVQLNAPEGARASQWLAGDSKILFARSEDHKVVALYMMDANSGTWFEIALPSDARVGQFSSFSPDAQYLAYPVFPKDCTGCHERYDLWALEVATGRTCLLAEKAPAHQYPQRVGWSDDSRYAMYSAKYEPGRWSERHAVDVATCVDTLLDPTPLPPTTTPLSGRLLDLEVSRRLRSPSGRYELIYGSKHAIPTLRPGETPPWAQEKPFLLTPTTGSAQMYILDNETGEVPTLLDENLEYQPFEWLP